MMKLDDLYPGVGTDIVIKRICIDASTASKGDLFVCTVGAVDNHNYIDEAIRRGASAVIVNHEVGYKSVPIIKIVDINRELPYLCQKFYGYPDKKMKMIGVTGTDGKTSVTSIIQTLIGSFICGRLGSNERSCAAFTDSDFDVDLDSTLFYDYLDEFNKFKCKYVAVEAESKDLGNGVLQSVMFDACVWTNISISDLHGFKTFEDYLKSKLKLFRQVKPEGICILNSSDGCYLEVKKWCLGKTFTYGTKDDDTLKIVSYKLFPNKTDIMFNYKGNEFKIESPLLGKFNVYNLAAALLTCLEIGFKLEDLLERIDEVKVTGVLQLLNTRIPYYVMVDSAKNLSSLDSIFDFVDTLDIKDRIVVIGQEGNINKECRHLIGKKVLERANKVIFTADNPRTEELDNIISDMISDVKDSGQYMVIKDRREAICQAISMANEKDIVLILGKGNENRQVIGNRSLHFNDIEEAYQAVVGRDLKEDNLK